MTIGEAISTYANVVPSQLLSVKPEPNSIPVRRFTFALENVIAQLNHRIPASTEKYATAAVYKFSGPQRHQLFWRHFRHLKSLLCKYNNTAVLKTLTDLQKRISSSTARSYYYMPTVDALRYIAATYLAQLFYLQKLRDCCIQTARMMLGYIEMGHWENLGLFVLGLCSEIHSAIPAQTKAICTAYDSFAEFVVAADESFPSFASSLPAVASLLSRTASSTTDSERVLGLLKMTEDQMSAAKLSSEMAKIKAELDTAAQTAPIADTTVDLGVTIERDEEFSQDEVFPNTSLSLEPPTTEKSIKKKAKKRKQLSSIDSAVADVSTAEETTIEAPAVEKIKKKKKKILANKTSLLSESSVFDDSLAEPRVNGVKKKKLKKSRPLEGEEPLSSTPLPAKKKKRLMDLSMSTINSEAEITPAKPKKFKKKSKSVEVDSVDCGADSSLLAHSPRVKKKKKKITG